MRALDLFAGPGGWDVAAAELGIRPLGIEYDLDACETRDAAGHPTLQGNVALLEPRDFAPCDLLIASPPCQAWSLAGKRGGELDLERVYEATARIAAGEEHPEVAWSDPRSALVTEPLRWALALRPRLIALEQVPPVLDYWRHVGELLRREGYGVWVGILEAERYGVAQTRERAILMAELDRVPHPPRPTHQRYVPGIPARHDFTLEGEILPWISMAEALGWTGRVNTRGDRQTPGGNEFDADRPSWALTEKTRSWLRKDDCNREGAGNQPRPDDAPAPTISTRLDLAEWTGHGYIDTRQSHAQARATDLPGPAMVGQNLAKGAAVWTDEPETETTEGTGYKPTKGVRVTEQEAAVLQGFPPDYPWQGSRSKKFQQIGNAICPPLAFAILEALT